MSSLTITLELVNEETTTTVKKGPIQINTPLTNPHTNLTSTIIKIVNCLVILSNSIQNKSSTLGMLIVDDHLVVDQSRFILNTKPNALYSNLSANDTNWMVTHSTNVLGIMLKPNSSTLAIPNQLIADYETISNP